MMSYSKLTQLLALALCLASLSLTAQPFNDEPCDAHLITVYDTCLNEFHGTFFVTRSVGPSAPSCGGYGTNNSSSFGDIWFTATVPANGILDITTIEGGDPDEGNISDGAMTVYTGDCNSLDEYACADDTNLLMPGININDGTLANTTVWIRFWGVNSFIGDQEGSFGICLTSTGATAVPTPQAEPACAANPIAEDICANAPLICNLDGYCGNTSSAYSPGPSFEPSSSNGDFCGTIENSSWIKFVANAETANFDIYPSNCATNSGVQIRIFGTTDCMNFVPKSNCVESTGQTYLYASDLTIGDTYYIYIDGNTGDNCDYTIAAEAGVNTIAATTTSPTICSGDATQLLVDLPDSGSFGYAWAPSADLNAPNVANPIATPTMSTLYTVTVTGACGATQTAAVNVTVNNCVANCPEINQSILTTNNFTTPLSSDLFISEYIEGSSTNKCIEIYNNTGAAIDLAAQNYQIRFFTNGNTTTAPFQEINLIGTIAYGDVFVICESNADAEFLAEADTTPFNGGYNGNDAIVLYHNAVEIDFFGQRGCDPGTEWTDGSISTLNQTLLLNPDITDGATNPTGTCGTTSFTTLPTNWTNQAIDYPHDLGHHTYTGQSSCTQVCPQEQICIEIYGSRLPAGGTIDFYASTTQGFDPYVDQTNLVGSATILTSNGPLEICFTLGETFCTAGPVFVAGIVNPHPDQANPTTDEGTTCEIGFTYATTPEYTFCLSCIATSTVINNNVSCNGGSDGSASVSPSGGTPGYSFLWDSGESTATASALTAGTHIVTITDQAACQKTTSVNIFQPILALTGTTTANDATCNGNSDGAATVSANAASGTGPYTYLWSNGPTTDQITGLVANTYTVTITDANGCSTTLDALVKEPTLLAITMTADQMTSCTGESDGSATAAVTGGTGAYSYLWDNNEVTATATNLDQGIHSVLVTDANSCTATATVSIAEPTPLIASATVNSTVSCNGSSDASVSVSVSGGTGAYTYLWNNTETTATITDLTSNTYFVIVSDANNCTQTAGISILQPTPLTAISTVDQAVSCNGGSDGAASVLANGGTPAYTYLWDNGATDASTTTLNQGTHTLTVTDANACTVTTTLLINEPTIVNATIIKDKDVNCNGGSDGAATASGSGGTSSYTYLWSNGQVSPSVSNLSQGLHSVTVTDGNGCSASAMLTIDEPTAISLSTTLDQTVSCNGGTDGAATVNAIGGTPSYTYLWDNNETNAAATQLDQGIHIVSVTDANACIATISITINEPSTLTASATLDNDVSCNNGSDGTATAGATGGTPNYSYLWDNAEMTATASNLSQGTHFVTITDLNDCMAIASVQVGEPTPLVANISTGSPVSCNNGSDGAATAFANGGSPTYTYLWSNGVTTPMVNNLGQGTHTVTITDSNGCSSTKAISILQPTPITSSIQLDQAAVCNGSSDGVATVTPNGGTPGYTFLWDNMETLATASNLDQGPHTVTITDANGCTNTNTITITEPPLLTVSSSLVNDVFCNGGNDGAATATPSGGTPNYTFLWDNGELTNIAISLDQGIHSVTVTDANDCTATSSIFIDEPTVLSATTNLDADVSCNGSSDGAATVTVTGGSPAYTYLWDNGEMTAEATNLGQGNHNVSVTDQNGCIAIATITINQPSMLTVNTNLDNHVSCNGGKDGAATANANGGTAPYSFLWDNGVATASVTNLNQGTHSITVTDDNGCFVIGSILINEPTTLTASISLVNDVQCNGGSDGSANATASGGTPSYNYAWSDGSTTALLSAVPAGNYTLTITDDNGCSSINGISIGEPTAAISINILFQAPASCTACDGIVDLNTTGGTAPYTYIWPNGETTEDRNNLCAGTVAVTITDSNNCTAFFPITTSSVSNLVINNTSATDTDCPGSCEGTAAAFPTGGLAPYGYLWDNNAGNQITQTADNLCAGDYIVSVSDANGCLETASITVKEPIMLQASAIATNPSCGGYSDGSLSAAVNGGTSPYTYLWSTSATSGSISGLTAGTYSLTVTDDHNCTTTTQTTLVEPTPLGITITGDQLDCNGDTDGIVLLSVTGGTSNYSYIWSTPTGMFFTQNLNNVGAGTYNVIVTDARGCQLTASTLVTELAAISSSIVSMTNNLCHGACDGSATLAASGGTGNYTYQWPASANNQTGPTAIGLCAGNYLVDITDDNGCTGTQFVSITEPDAMSATLTDTPVSCNGGSDGTAVALISGGAAPYLYLWSNGATTELASNLPSGSYELTVTDDNSCVRTFATTVGSATAISITVSTQATSCNGTNDGTATANAGGGTPGYTYSWSTGDGFPTIVGQTSSTYTVTVTDNNACTQTTSVFIDQPSAIGATVSTSPVSCFGALDGTALLFPTGGVTPYTYQWDDGSANNPATFLSAGAHQVIITDFTGCSTVKPVIIDGPDPITFSLSTSSPTCFGDTNGTGTMSVSGGTAPYVIIWGTNPPKFGPSVTGLSSGTINVSVMDDNQCTLGPISVTVSDAPVELTATVEVNVTSCFDGNDGIATAIPTGGIASYTYLWNDGQTGQSAFNLMPGTYTVTITDQNGCTTFAANTITQPAQIQSAVTSVGVTCGGDGNGSITIDEMATFGGEPPYTYSIDGGNFQMSPIFNGLDGGQYDVYVLDANACEIVLQVLVDEPPALSVDLGVDQVIQLGDSTSLNAELAAPLPVAYDWTPSEGLSCTDCPTPSVRPVMEVSYQVMVTDTALGCTALDDITIFVEDNRFVYIPNAFTPNNDGNNDIVTVYGGKGVTVVRQFLIFNRWGELVFEAANFAPSDEAFGWAGLFKGKKVNPGVYVYFAEVEFDDGVLLEYKGDVTVVK